MYAQGILGGIYDTGLGVPQDKAEATRWYRLVADAVVQGDAKAQDFVGLLDDLDEARTLPQSRADAAVSKETATQPESGLGKWFGVGVSIAIGGVLIMIAIAQL